MVLLLYSPSQPHRGDVVLKLRRTSALTFESVVRPGHGCSLGKAPKRRPAGAQAALRGRAELGETAIAARPLPGACGEAIHGTRSRWSVLLTRIRTCLAGLAQGSDYEGVRFMVRVVRVMAS